MISEGVIIGRVKERSDLYKEIDLAVSGRGAAIFVSGESGVGKTRLVEDVVEKSGMYVFSARANDEGSPSYELFRIILTDMLNHHGYGGIQKDSLPEHIFSILNETAKPGTSSASEIQEAVITLLNKFSGIHPALLFFDDIQWADNASLDLLQKVCERIASSPLVILALYRSDEITNEHKIRKIRNNLRRGRRIKEIELKPLDFFETKSLVESLLNGKVEESLSEKIYLQTQGLPLFTEEVVNTLLDENYLINGENGFRLKGTGIPVPESIKDAVLQRITKLSPEAKNFIESASILGIEFNLEAAFYLSGSEKGLDELFEKKLLHEISPGKASFRHIIIKEAIYEGIAWSRRKNLHRNTAVYYEENNYPPELIAEHWMSSNETEKAREALIKSIEQSCSLYAFDDAAEKANLALQIWPEHKDEEERIKILYKYAHCSQINGKTDEALKALDEIMESSYFGVDSIFSAEVFKLQGTVYGLKGMWNQSVNARINAAGHYMKAGLFAESSAEFLIAASRSTAMLNLEKALQNAEFSVKTAQEADRDDLKARAMGLQGNILSMQGKVNIGKDVVRRALNIALQSRNPEAASEVYRRLASTLEYASDYTAARDAYLGAYDYCVSTGENVNAQVCLGCMSYVFFQTGDWKSSLEITRKVINSDTSPEGSKAVAYAISALINTFRGDIKNAERHLAKGYELARKYSNTSVELAALWGYAILSENAGDKSEAADKYNLIILKWYETQDNHDIIPMIMWAAAFYAGSNMIKENSRCIEILAGIASSTGNPEAMAALAFALAESSCMNKDYFEARKQYNQALQHLEKLTIPLQQIFVEYRLAVCLIYLGEIINAGTLLSRIYKTAKNMNMRPFASLIAEKMSELGLTAEESRNTESYFAIEKAGLTRRQKEILQLVSEGLTNKEISGKIFLSTRTVDMHVSNILQRFNCRTRTEAVTKAKAMQIL